MCCAFCDSVVNGDVVPERVPGVMLLLSFSRDGKETLFGIDDDIIFVVLCWGWSKQTIKMDQPTTGICVVVWYLVARPLCTRELNFHRANFEFL